MLFRDTCIVYGEAWHTLTSLIEVRGGGAVGPMKAGFWGLDKELDHASIGCVLVVHEREKRDRPGKPNNNGTIASWKEK